MHTAVLLVIFKRPDLTERLMEILGRVKPPRLYVAADGPRPGRGEEALCAAARECAAKAGWPCEVFTDYSAENLGAGHRVATAITWFFKTEEEGIIVEDDCIPDDTFFRYCEELLERYREDERVMVVSGYRGPAAPRPGAPSYSFSKYPVTWGWATWRRAWKHHDINLTKLPEWETYKRSARFRENCFNEQERRLWIRDAERALSELDAWDIQWLLICWMRGGLCIVPARSLIQNFGLRADGTHLTDDIFGIHKKPASPMRWPLTHPDAVAVDAAFDRETWFKMYRPPTFLQRVYTKIVRVSKRLLK